MQTDCGNTVSCGVTADSSANETEGARVCDLVPSPTGDESPVVAGIGTTVVDMASVAGKTELRLADVGI
jgi:hypothetical protein